MSLWLERMGELTHYYGYLREAEQERLAHQALEGRQKKQRIYGRVMSWLGSRLSAIGNVLQERYGSDTAAIVFVAETRR
jgi:hypothetical protein